MNAFYAQAVQQKGLEACLVCDLHVREAGAVGLAVRRAGGSGAGGAVAPSQVIGADETEGVSYTHLDVYKRQGWRPPVLYFHGQCRQRAAERDADFRPH